MTSSVIRFGTDGWRAVIGEQYTFDNVARVALATADWLTRKSRSPSVVLGYDTRFEGRAFAAHAARVLASQGVDVMLTHEFTATPAVSWAVKEYGRTAGIVLTASHNPPEWNGFKLKAGFGGPALPAQVAEVEALIPGLEAVPSVLPGLHESGHVRIHDVKNDYLSMLSRRIDVSAIRDAGLHVAHDAMYGAGQGMLSALLGSDRVVETRSSLNPGFAGGAPEPIERNLEAFPGIVTAHGCAAGIANDGDADRIGMVDEHGRFVDSHRLLALLLAYLHEGRGLTGEVVKTFSTTDMLDRMTEAFGLVLHTTPIGFKYVCEYILERDILVGGEESGGIAVKGHLPERDGIYIGLLVLEMLAHTRRPLSSLIDDLYARFGRHAYWRVDVHTTEARKNVALDTLRDGGGLTQVMGRPVVKFETLDGFKHRTDRGWVLVRPSGTEPVLRVYAEAEDQDTARRLVEDAVKQLGVA